MKVEIIITHPIEPDGYERTDIDYYEKNGKRIATVVRPLNHLHYKGNCVKVKSISKDDIVKVLKTLKDGLNGA
jgi:hypothetical protein